MSVTVYRRLTVSAKERIRWSDLTVAGYCRLLFGGLDWAGDVCGCPDDRCIGHHHDEHEECACLPAVLERPDLWARTPAPHSA